MDIQNKYLKFVLELTKKTLRGEVTWTSAPPSQTIRQSDETIQDLVYSSIVSNKEIRVYKYKTKLFRNEYDFDYVDRIRIETLDKNNNAEYEFPYDYSMHNLYQAIREKTSNISGFVDEFLKS